MKTCFKCHRELALDAFYKHKQMGDGRLGKCKDCTKKDVNANREGKIEYYREFDRNRPRRDSKSPLMDNPVIMAAHNKLQRSVARGELKRRPCMVCKTTEKVLAHHEDYRKPLQVLWLCQIHHKARHKELREMGIDIYADIKV